MRKHKHFVTVEEINKQIMRDLNIQPPTRPSRRKPALDDVITCVNDYFWDFDFPRFQWVNPKDKTQFGDYTETFKRRFLEYFWTQRTAFTNGDDFRDALQGVLNIIMPEYNRKLYSEQWFDLFISNPSWNNEQFVEETRETNNDSQTLSTSNSKGTTEGTSEGTTESTTTSNATTSAYSESKNSTNDTPNASMTGEMWDEVDTGQYMSNIGLGNSKTVNDSDSTTTATGKDTGSTNSTSETNSKDNTKGESKTTEKFTHHQYGNLGVQTPAQVFGGTREVIYNTIDELFNDYRIGQLFHPIQG